MKFNRCWTSKVKSNGKKVKSNGKKMKSNRCGISLRYRWTSLFYRWTSHFKSHNLPLDFTAGSVLKLKSTVMSEGARKDITRKKTFYFGHCPNYCYSKLVLFEMSIFWDELRWIGLHRWPAQLSPVDRKMVSNCEGSGQITD